MRIYYDAEFHEDGRTIDLISLGMVAEDGRELYLINADADWTRISAHEWLAEHVLPHLPGAWSQKRTAGEPRMEWRPDWSDIRVDRYATIGDQAERFIRETDDPELWAYYGAYDHVALAQLWGPMAKLPAGVPMWTNDLQQECERLRRQGFPVRKPEQPINAHDALADARWNLALGSNIQRLDEVLARAVIEVTGP